MEDTIFVQTAESQLKFQNECSELYGEKEEPVLYTLTGILDFLQSEWAKMEMERSQWELERSELQAKISFLQGECMGQENLKADLVRRIKMLEYALIQERNKNFRLKCSNEIGTFWPTINRSEDFSNIHQIDSLLVDPVASKLQNDRLRLKNYLINTGLGDAMNRLRSTRIQDLLASSNADGEMDQLSNMDETVIHAGAKNRDRQEDDTTDVNLKFPPTIDEATGKQIVTGNAIRSHLKDDLDSLSPSLFVGEVTGCSDPETMDALNEFEMLVAQHESAVIDMHSSNGGLSDWSGFMDPLNEDGRISGGQVRKDEVDSVDEKELLARFKEQYRASRPRAARPSLHLMDSGQDSALRENLELVDDIFSLSSFSEDIDVKRPSRLGLVNPFLSTTEGMDDIQKGCFELDSMGHRLSPPTAVSRQLFGADSNVTRRKQDTGAVASIPSIMSPTSSLSTVSGSLGLGDLASLTVANESDAVAAAAHARAMDNLDGVGDFLGVGTSGSGKLLSSSPTGTGDRSGQTAEVLPWTAKYTLRSHFDAIRAISFHPTEPLLASASEDHTLKLWNLTKTVQAKKSTTCDVEPIYTFRGHENPVLSLALYASVSSSAPVRIASDKDPSSDDFFATSSDVAMALYSGDLGGKLRAWMLPSLQLDPCEAFDPNMFGLLSLQGHTDAIWSLAVRPDGVLLSASADETACLWPTGSLFPTHIRSSKPTLLAPFQVYPLTSSLLTALSTKSYDPSPRERPTPTSTVFLPTRQNHFLSGFTSGHSCIVDVETGQLITTFIPSDGIGQQSASFVAGSVTSLAACGQQPLIITAHEDRQIRFFDVGSGKCVHSMVAHQDSVTTVCLDPQEWHLLSASHDCSIRLWSMSKKTCVQEITSHRKKFGESINAVAFHPTRRFMASAGADALAKVFI